MRTHWTKEELSALHAHYPAVSAQRLQGLLPDRTVKAIHDQARKMGVGKMHERLREMGRENVSVRYVFKKTEISA